MSSCSVMTRFGFGSAMSCRDIGGNGPPSRGGNHLPLPTVQSVRRKLFGDVDHQQNQEDLERELRIVEERDRDKYNYDFKTDQPINLPDSRFEWSHIDSDINDTEDKDSIKSQQLSTKLCKLGDEEVANPSHSQSVSSSVITSSQTMSSSFVPKSRPTSATISPDSQSQASSSCAQSFANIEYDVKQAESQVKMSKQSTQTKITEFFDGRKSAVYERKRSAVMSVSHKDRQTSTTSKTSKRHRPECTSAVEGEDTDTTDSTDTDTDDPNSVQTTGTPV